MSQLITPSAYAATRKERGLRGASRQAVSKWIKTGRLTKAAGSLVEAGGKVWVDPARADLEIDGNTDQSKIRDNKPIKVREARSDGQARNLTTLTEARTKRETANAAKAGLEVLEYSGRLVERAALENQLYAAFRLWDTQRRGMGNKLAQRLASLSDPVKIARIIDEEMDLMHKELMRTCKRLADEAGKKHPGPGAAAQSMGLAGAGHQPSPETDGQ